MRLSYTWTGIRSPPPDAGTSSLAGHSPLLLTDNQTTQQGPSAENTRLREETGVQSPFPICERGPQTEGSWDTLLPPCIWRAGARVDSGTHTQRQGLCWPKLL